MRKSISIWSFSPTLSLTDRLRLAREAGFDGFEVDLSDDGPLTPGSSAALQQASIGARIRRAPTPPCASAPKPF